MPTQRCRIDSITYKWGVHWRLKFESCQNIYVLFTEMGKNEITREVLKVEKSSIFIT